MENKIKNTRYDFDGIVKVVKEDQIQELTEYGWKILDTFESVEIIEECFPKEYHHYNDAREKKYYEAKIMKFIIGRENDNIIAILEEKLKNQEDKNLNLNHELLQSKKELEKILKLHKEIQEKLKKEINNRESVSLKRDELYEVKRKMENDLAKIRQAIGDLKFREIVETI